MSLKKMIKNKYFTATAIFLGYLLFIDQYDFRAQYQLLSELYQLENEKDFYQNELQKDSATYFTLFNDQENLERYAREKFMMKKPNEDIFIIVNEDK